MRRALPATKALHLFLILLSLPLLFGATAFAGQVVDTVERNFTVPGRPAIVLRNGGGRSRITADNQAQVRVKATKEVRRAANEAEARQLAEQVQVRIEQSGNRIDVEAHYPKHIGNFFVDNPEVLVHFEVIAPRSSDIDARSTDGSLGVYGFDGKISITTGDGDLTADNCSGNIIAQTGDGSLEIESVRGDVSAHTGDGSMTLDGVFQGLDAKSGDGRIDIRARAGSKMGRDWSIHSGDGNVRLRLPEGFAATMELGTGDGNIDSEQPIAFEVGSSKKHVLGKLNGGGYRLRIQTGDGDINIRKS